MLFLIDEGENFKEYICKSSNVLHIKYRFDIKKMTITFKSGKQYLYENVKKNVLEELLRSKSIGNTVHNIFVKKNNTEINYNEKIVAILNEEQMKYLYNIINNI